MRLLPTKEAFGEHFREPALDVKPPCVITTPRLLLGETRAGSLFWGRTGSI